MYVTGLLRIPVCAVHDLSPSPSFAALTVLFYHGGCFIEYLLKLHDGARVFPVHAVRYCVHVHNYISCTQYVCACVHYVHVHTCYGYVLLQCSVL